MAFYRCGSGGGTEIDTSKLAVSNTALGNGHSMTVSSESYDRIILILWNSQASKNITINITQGEGAVIGAFGFGIPSPSDGSYGKLLYLAANSVATISNNSTGSRYDEVRINYIRLN